MTLLAVTTETWIVTGVGFGLVLVLLTIFVFIMKLFGLIMGTQSASKPAEKAATKPAVTYANDADGATKAAIAMTLAMAQNDAEKAAVAYALHLYYNVHDNDNCRLTIENHPTAWNDKTYGINNLIR